MGTIKLTGLFPRQVSRLTLQASRTRDRRLWEALLFPCFLGPCLLLVLVETSNAGHRQAGAKDRLSRVGRSVAAIVSLAPAVLWSRPDEFPGTGTKTFASYTRVGASTASALRSM